MRVVAILGLASVCSGCLVLPPARLSVGTGAVAVASRPTEVPLDVRASLHPMQLDEAALGRRFDFGVGYMRSWAPSTRIDGGFAEASFVLWNRLGTNPFARRGPQAYVRLLLQGQLRVLGERSLPRLGWGGAAGVVLETGSYVSVFDGPADHEGLYGRVRGEASTGIYIEGADATLGGVGVWSFSTGLVVRTPGVLMLPLFDRM